VKINRIPIPGFIGVQVRFTRRVAVALAFHKKEVFHLNLRGGETVWVPFGIWFSKRAVTLAFLLLSVTFTRLEKKL
tara:strand:+ start:6262 stop:6489 length:228 start_codon:yes stop_codon:yes gene_type:complete